MKAEDYLSRFLTKISKRDKKENERLAKVIAEKQAVRAITEGPKIIQAGRPSYVD